MHDNSYTAIETSRGLLFFSEDAQGRKLLQKYFQEMTDRYFDPDFALGPVRLYNTDCLPKEAKQALNPSARPLESYDYLPADRLLTMSREAMRLCYENDMAPTPAVFRDFLAATHTHESQRNENIRTMLEGLETYERTIAELSSLPPSGQTRRRIDRLCPGGFHAVGSAVDQGVRYPGPPFPAIDPGQPGLERSGGWGRSEYLPPHGAWRRALPLPARAGEDAA